MKAWNKDRAEIKARAVADAEVARVSRVSKHIDRDDLDDVWQEAYDRTLRLELDAYEAELDALEEDEYDQRRLGEYYADRKMEKAAALRRLGLIPINTNRVCHECQSRPCRCAEFASEPTFTFKEIDEETLMDDLQRLDDEYCNDIEPEPPLDSQLAHPQFADEDAPEGDF